MYSTDNGPHRNTWPDGGMTPFRSEKNTNWEGAFRIPLLVRWPGKIEAGSVANGIVQHHDWLPTFLAMAGAPDVVEKLKKGYKAIGRTYKNHIDGFNLLPYLTGEAKESPRNFFFYFSDDGDMLAMRYDNWKIVFMEQRCEGTMEVWAEPFTRCACRRSSTCDRPLRVRGHHVEHLLRLVPPQRLLHLRGAGGAAKFAETFKEFPPVQRPNTFTIDDAMAKMAEAASGRSFGAAGRSPGRALQGRALAARGVASSRFGNVWRSLEPVLERRACSRTRANSGERLAAVFNDRAR